jgi:hypothetical protein
MALKCSILAAVLALAPLAALAQTSEPSQSSYRCVGKDGKKYYGAVLPPQCAGQRVEQLSNQGVVVRRIDPEGEEKMRAVKEAEAAKKREDDAIAQEASRRNRALLATYSSEKDIDEALGRALSDNDRSVKEIEQRIGEIKKRQAGYDKEMEFYQDGAKQGDKKAKPGAPAPQAKAGPQAPPPKLLQDMKSAEGELLAQESLLASKKKEVETINAKYAEDKRRFTELTKRSK